MNFERFVAKITKTVGSIVRVYSILFGWLFVALIMVYDYWDQGSHPLYPVDGFTPSSYHPPNLILVIITLILMIFELGCIYLILFPRRRGNQIFRVFILWLSNFCWLLFSFLISGFRPPEPLIWHFGWLLLLQMILTVDIVVFLIKSSFRALLSRQ